MRWDESDLCMYDRQRNGTLGASLPHIAADGTDQDMYSSITQAQISFKLTKNFSSVLATTVQT